MSLSLADRGLARRYARAFYADLGPAQAGPAAAELARAARALEGKVGSLRHPRIGPEERKRQLGEALKGAVSPRTLAFLELLLEKKRLELLGAVAEDFSSQVDEERGVLHADVRTASPLGPEQAQRLQAGLKGFFGKDIVLQARVTPELIGGAVVRVGDWVFDASLQGELSRLRESMSE